MDLGHKSSVCVCVVIPFILDVRFVHVPAGVAQEEGHTGFLIHLPSGACRNFSREKDSAAPFPRLPWGRILCGHEIVVLQVFKEKSGRI